MSDVAISITGLSKRYRLGPGPQGHGDLRETVTAAVRRLARRRKREGRERTGDGREFWALRDVSFEVRRGEVVGIIGPNGAGKSTLLKILGRITDPSAGSAWFAGRIGSLLEVGTGFHPELSGRENVFLSGAILGMPRGEVARKFDEIVEFSGVARFLDVPVKRYSSGMYVRLGFAVAAHLDSDILIVDEVLAVGDAAFQRKCLARMKAAANEGRSILLVSHGMGSVQSLCDRAVVLSGGRLIADADPLEAITLYLKSVAESQPTDLAERTNRRGRGHTRVLRASIHSDGHEDAGGVLICGQPAVVRFELSAITPELACTFAIYDRFRRAVCRFSSRMPGPDDEVADGRSFVCRIPELTLVPGPYHLNVRLTSGSELEDHVESALTFNVDAGLIGGRLLGPDESSGIVAMRHVWTVPQ